MKGKKLIGLIFGFFLTFVMMGNAFAETGETMMEKQQKIDKYLFEDKKDELAALGITVNHTVALDSIIEIGITPLTEENIAYFQTIFGIDQVTIVEGQQAVTLEINNPTTTEMETTGIATTEIATQTQEKPTTNGIYIYIIGLIIIFAGTFFALTRRRRAVNKY